MSKIPVFDIGDTLVPSHSKINEVIREVVGEETPKIDINKYNVYVPEQINQWFDEQGIEADGEEVTEKYLEWKSNYLKQNMIPDLKKINQHYGPIGFISDNSKPAKKFYKENFDNAGLNYEGFTVSAEVGAEKPDPKIFEAFVQERKEDAEDFVYFGNYVDRDKAAEKVGMDFVWVKSFHTFGSETEGVQINKVSFESVEKAVNKVSNR